MDLKLFSLVFLSVFLAELGDKTQLATALFAARNAGQWPTVFAAGSAALVVATGLAVLAGQFIASHVSTDTLAYVAGGGFVAIGLWIIASTFLG